ncbi:MAG: STAS domain-containing protein [Bacillota bacterium]|nr:STAS domain-containing protein [Bacillota bacterium]MDD3297735.1 STAS domain-containing protein [Bacillota bacterium]MDD3850071.1 STAS domain-containing protein [Bacillota bacterium]MDD4706692.1 STAS domain-containing protein [Bacillota bacterium]
MSSQSSHNKNDGGEFNMRLKGEIDIYTAAEFKKQLNAAIDEDLGDLHLDCSELQYMDSTGLGVLIGALKRMKEQDRNIYISNLRPNVRKLFSITGLDKIFILEV